jgi:Fe-S-cluster-containing hydrogenase component 2
MPISNDELQTIIKANHTALAIFMPGTTAVCPGNAIIVKEQQVQVAIYGCKRCMALSIAGLMQSDKDFKEIMLQALQQLKHY